MQTNIGFNHHIMHGIKYTISNKRGKNNFTHFEIIKQHSDTLHKIKKEKERVKAI